MGHALTKAGRKFRGDDPYPRRPGSPAASSFLIKPHPNGSFSIDLLAKASTHCYSRCVLSATKRKSSTGPAAIHLAEVPDRCWHSRCCSLSRSC
jgi:hypothetical protein